jgi:hypothetical protein
MSDRTQAQVDAATGAAEARAAIAKKIASIVGKVQGSTDADVVLRLAQAYAALATEPPRTRGGGAG